MTRYRICPLLCFAIAVVFVCASAIASERRPMTVDDMMKIEGFGAAASDPNGRWLLFEQLRPYEESDDFSFRTYAMTYTGHQLRRYDLQNVGAPELLPGLAPTPSSYLQGFSPSGRFLGIMQYRLGALSLGAYDMQGEKAVMFSQMPAFSRDGAHNPVWIADDELMYAALPEGEVSEWTSVRAHTGSTVSKAWEDAWRGDVVTADEVRTSALDESDQQEPGYLVRANARTGKSEVIAEGLYADLRVSPDRRYLAALAMSKPRPIDSDELAEQWDQRRYRIKVFDLDTGESLALAQELEFFPYTIAWAPDAKRLAAYGWTSDEGPRTGRFYVVDVQTGAAVRYDHVGLELTSERERGWLQRPERVSFLGDGLAVFARRIPEVEDQSPRFTYQDVGPVGLSKPDWYALSADGTSRNLTAGLPDVSGVPVHAGDGHLTVTAEDGVYRLYADGQRRRLTSELPGRFRLLTPGTLATRIIVIRPEFGQEALFDVTGNGPAKIVMVDLRDGHEGETVVIDAPADDASPLAGSLASNSVLFSTQDGRASQLILASGDGNAPPREVARVNDHLTDVDPGVWRVVSYEVEDPEGKQPPRTLESCVLLPPGYRESHPPPLVVEVYPNTRPRCSTGGDRVDSPRVMSPYLWAGKGYAYARLTTPRALIQTADGPIAGMPDMVEAGVAALVAEGFADPERLTLYGFSQGGISALYVAAHSQRFKAIIAMNSWANLFSHYFGANGVYSYSYGKHFGNFTRYDSVAGTDFGIGRTPFQDPEAYIRNSPVFLAPRIDAPVLLIHSDMDSFSMSQFDEMFGALRRTGKDVRYVRYWGEGHAPSSPANIRDLWKRLDAFIIENGGASGDRRLKAELSADPAS